MSLGIVAMMIAGVIFTVGGCMYIFSKVGDFDPIAVIGGARADVETPRVLELNLGGIISLDAGSSSFYSDKNSSATVLRAIREATGDESIRGILLNIDSGGGEMTASDIIWKALCDFKEGGSDRYVVVHMGAVAASGAYYISCAADKIVAHPTTMTGSIGVKIPSYNVKELTDKIGIKNVTITSGENKEITHPMNDMTPEQEAILRKNVMQLHERFVSIIVKGRGLAEENANAIADGRILLAAEAESEGLIDLIGYEKDAKKLFEDRFGEKPIFIRHVSGPFSFLKNPAFYGEAAAAAIEAASKSEERLTIR